MQAAVKAKLIAAAVPNIAARHQRGPRSARTTAVVIAPVHARIATTHRHSGGGSMPYWGWAKYRNPASPAVTPTDPIHSRRPIRKPNQKARMAARNTSSVVRIGWT